MATWQLPAELSQWIVLLAHVLDARIEWRLRPMLVGLLFARGRRTITSWLRAIGVRREYEDYYYFLASLGRKCESVAGILVRLILRQLPLPERVLFALDDTPTKRYGPHVEGAGIHHNPTPGRRLDYFARQLQLRAELPAVEQLEQPDVLHADVQTGQQRQRDCAEVRVPQQPSQRHPYVAVEELLLGWRDG